MRNAVESLCSLCVIAALVEQIHGSGRYYGVIRLILALQTLMTLIAVIRGIL